MDVNDICLFASGSLSLSVLFLWICCGAFVAQGMITNFVNQRSMEQLSAKGKIVKKGPPSCAPEDKTSKILGESTFTLFFGSMLWRVVTPIRILPFEPFYGCDPNLHAITTVPFVICFLCFRLRLSAMKSLGKFFARATGVRSAEKHTVISTGPFQYIRHPGYSAGAILLTVCAFCVTGDFIIGAAFSAQYLYVLLALRIPEEEDMLRTDASTGEDYKKYMGDVRKKIIPFLI